jgi:DNA (cytosine-5)-methyltransferase 1
MRSVITADLFCGAGGASTGIKLACSELGIANRNYCVNHWDVAIATHSLNHPEDKHVCAPVETVIPNELVTGGKLDLLWASPSCTHHSRAKGGKPRSNQLRAQPNMILDWLDMLYVKRLIVENVWEFTEWGPLGYNGKPIKSKRGECFRAWIDGIRSRNYRVEWRRLNCADYGDATTRERFFLQAVKIGSGKIAWPDVKYAKDPQPDMFVDLKRWRGIGECLDLSDIGNPLSQRKKPLSGKTMERIAEGIRKFHGEKFLVDFMGLDKPGASGRTIPIDSPMSVQHCCNRYGLATPFVVDYMKNGNAKGIAEPINAQHCKDRFAVVTPFLFANRSSNKPRSMDEPCAAITTSPGGGGIAMATPFIVKLEKNSKPITLEHPISTQTTSNKFYIASPVIIPQHAPASPRSADEPVSTITTTGAIGMATPVLDGDYRLVDVFFRMLKPCELAKATGFPDDYVLTGNKGQQVKQIGNAVPVNTAKEIVRSAFAGLGAA